MSAFIIVFLGCLFVFSAAAKAFDWRNFMDVVSDVGVSRRMAPTAAFLVPVAEAAVAVLLIRADTRSAGLVLMLALLVSFSWAAWKAKGKGIECHCFGRAVSEEFGFRTYVRIGVCGILAAYLLTYPDRSHLYSSVPEELLLMFLLSCGILAGYMLLSAIATYKKTGLSL